jgi:carbonic anhydrase
MSNFEKLLADNKQWAKNKVTVDPEYFSRLEHLQTPEYLWIGCSDSRVPANQITGTQPGEIFVHRNIANLVVSTDVNLLSVLQYAVEVLKVKHIIVCGHYGCGGVKAALTNVDHKQVLNMWFRHIKDVYRIHKDDLESLPDGDLRTNRLIEWTVIEQVYNLAKTSIVQKAWKSEQRPVLHGWVYSLKDGIINPIYKMDFNSYLDPIYQYEQ